MIRPIAVDLFAGCGGMSLGLEQAGFDVLASVEIDPVHCATHKFNFPNCQIINQDICQVTGESIRNKSTIKDQEITVVVGGSPCQGFSIGGKRSLDDPRNLLTKEFIRVVLELQPKYFIFENVKGSVMGKQKQYITDIIDTFRNNGYQVLDYEILNAIDYGVPQSRERIILLGARNNLNLPGYPNKKLKVPTVLAAIKDLPEASLYKELYDRDWVKAEFSEPSNYGSLLRGLTRADDDYSCPRINNPDILTSSILTVHTQEVIKRFKDTTPGQTESISRFKRLHPQGISPTLRAGTGSERGAHTAARPIHPIYPRVITNREAARLHSYPDWFRFHVTKWHGFRQIGNSVPPLMAKAIAQQIIKEEKIIIEPPVERISLGDFNLLTLTTQQAQGMF